MIWSCLSNFELKMGRPKTMPKYFLKNFVNYFEKVQSTTFSTPKIARNDPAERSKWANIWPTILIFRVIHQPFELKKKNKTWTFNTDNKAWTVPKQLKYNSKKSQENDFFDHQNGKNDPSNLPKWVKNLTENFDFPCHLSIILAENTHKRRPFKAKNNA